MQLDLTFLLGLLDRDDPAYVSQEDFAGDHRRMLRLWQRMGFLSRVPERHPVPSCPRCREGTPLLLAGRCICAECGSTVDSRHLLLWRFDLEAFLGWLARQLRLTGGVRQVEETLWQMGGFLHQDVRFECFFQRGGLLGERGRQRLLAYRNAVVLHCLPSAERIEGFAGPRLSLLDMLRQDARSLRVTELTPLLDGGRAIRFDEASGSIFLGGSSLGEVSVGSKEYFLLVCLSRQQDRFIAYADLKHFVLQQSGSTDETEEANFCQKLKSRIKKHIPEIDRLIVTTNKADGYQLRRAM
jgi:hypothetical protein